jgi:ATP adenylyltransferase
MAKKESLKDVLKNVWPQERDIFVRPERLKYVRKLIKTDGCVFCNAVKAKDLKENLVVYKSDKAMVILNKYPYNTGHVLVMPTRHIGELEKMSAAEVQEVHALLPKTVEILKKVYNCAGLNVGLNLGAVAGAGIPDHLHYHVIPRWGGDTNFFPLIAETKMVVETLDETYGRLIGEFKKIGKKK